MYTKLAVTVWILLFALSACVSTEQHSPGTDQEITVSHSIGWIDGNCLAINRPALAIGTTVTVVIPGESEKILSARISGSADSGEQCTALLADRRSINAQEDVEFYMLESQNPIPVGIAILATDTTKVYSTEEMLDINQSGNRGSFSYCMTGEGIRYDAWSAQAYKSEKLWSSYYYLGYDTQPDCPDD